MVQSSVGSIKPTTLRGVLLVIMVALIGESYTLIISYSIGGIIIGVVLDAIAVIIAMLVVAPFLPSNDPLIKDLQQIDTTLLPYLPLLIKLLPVLETALSEYGPNLAVLLNQLLADQAQRNKNQVQPPTQ